MSKKPTPKIKKTKSVEVSHLKVPYIYDYILIVFALLLSFYIRAIIPHDATFARGIIAFASDDAVYHMRLVENLVTNFPHKIWFEVFTKYPFGQPLHFGPLMTYTIAITALILGLGHPTLELTQTIGAYYPAVIGTLLIIPVYVITKTLFSRKAAIFASFLLAVMPGQILQRSTLGFTDHHIGEVFFSSIFIMFFMLALKSSKGEHNIIIGKTIHKSIIYSVFAGIFFSLYLLQWSPGVFIGGVVAIFITLQFIINHLKGEDNNNLMWITVITFLFATPLVLLFFDSSKVFALMEYSWLHVLITLGMAIFFLFLEILSSKFNKKNIDKKLYPATLILIFISIISIVKVTLPLLFSQFNMFFSIFSVPTGGQATIAEAGTPTPGMIVNNYPAILGSISLYHIALIAMIVLGLSLLYRWNPEKGLFLIWSGMMFLLTTGQNRWFYYYSFNVVILTSFLLFSIIDSMKFTTFTNNIHELKFKEKELTEFFSSKFNTLHIVTIVLILYFVLVPHFNIAQQSTVNGVVSPSYYEWRDAMGWMKENTPETGLDFDVVYTSNFEYPESAYGVMSWWDYGHVITYYGERIPNANPFQHGIGGGPDKVAGASTFFTAQSEEEAVKIADELGVKYVVSDAYMAYSINDIMAVWAEDTYNYRQVADIPQRGGQQYVYGDRWYSNMESKLHIFDTSGLSHFRLIYESGINPNTMGGSQEQFAKYFYDLTYTNTLPIVNSGYVKIFEYVPGATIIGSVEINDIVTVYLPLNSTLNNRTFVYTRTIVPQNNVFEVIVPYSTDKDVEINPLEGYLIVQNNVIISRVNIPESAVMNGEIIYV